MCYQDGLRAAQKAEGEDVRGAVKDADQGQGQASGGGPSRRKAGGYSQAKALHAMPSPLEFLSYVLAAGNLLAGPFFEAHDYFDYIQRRVRPNPR